MRRSEKVWRTVAFGLTAVLVAALAFTVVTAVLWWRDVQAQTRADFRAVDVVVTQLAITEMGEVKFDARSGSHQVIEGQPATRTIVVLLAHIPAAGTKALVDDRLTADGYASSSVGASECAQAFRCSYHHVPQNRVSIDLTVHEPGDEILWGDERHPDLDLVVPPGASALEIIVTKV
jgi:DNA-binding NarL/FixJ family response regulator